MSEPDQTRLPAYRRYWRRSSSSSWGLAYSCCRWVGLALWADQGLHSATPLLTLLFWLVFAPKAPLPWKMALYWLAWPLIYVTYALIRGSFTKVYPYPFIDLNALSIGQFAMNAIGLCIAFFLAGIVLIGIARGIAR